MWEEGVFSLLAGNRGRAFSFLFFFLLHICVQQGVSSVLGVLIVFRARLLKYFKTFVTMPLQAPEASAALELLLVFQRLGHACFRVLSWQILKKNIRSLPLVGDGYQEHQHHQRNRKAATAHRKAAEMFKRTVKA